MNREIEFEEDAVCDNCGAKGAFDFMGDYLCGKCAESNSSGCSVQSVVRPFVVVDPYQSDGLALGVWSDKYNGYLFGDGDIYTLEQMKKSWEHAEYLSFGELERRIVREGVIREGDIVFSRVDLSGVRSGTKGTVVHIYKNGKALEVEFINEDGTHVVKTVLVFQVFKEE